MGPGLRKLDPRDDVRQVELHRTGRKDVETLEACSVEQAEQLVQLRLRLREDPCPDCRDLREGHDRRPEA